MNKLPRVCSLVKRVFGFAAPLFLGVSVLGGWGMLPRGNPLNTVVGKPIVLPKYVRGDAVIPGDAAAAASSSSSSANALDELTRQGGQEAASEGTSTVQSGSTAAASLQPHSVNEKSCKGWNGNNYHNNNGGGSFGRHHDVHNHALTHHGPPDPELEALVDQYHGEFMAAVQQLWEQYKDVYAPHRVREMRFV